MLFHGTLKFTKDYQLNNPLLEYQIRTQLRAKSKVG